MTAPRLANIKVFLGIEYPPSVISTNVAWGRLRKRH